MEKETKQTLISLSLAGAIGYYLYKKLVQADAGLSLGYQASAKEKTDQDLCWNTTPNIQPQEYEQSSECLEEFSMETVPQIEETYIEEEQTQIETENDVLEEQMKENSFDDDSAEVQAIDEQNEQTLVNTSSELENVELNEQVFEDIVLDEQPVEIESIPQTDLDETTDGNEQTEEPQLDFSSISLEDNVSNETELDEVVLEEPSLDVEELNLDDLNFTPPVLEQPTVTEQSESSLVIEEPKVEEVAELPVEEVKIEEVQPKVDDELDEIKKELNLDNIDAKENDMDSEKERGIDDLFKNDRTIMENVEPLHKIDQQDESSKKEFKSIMDFFSTL